jgi:hypothetical protein
MPECDAKYDSGKDSFGSIFSDLLTGAAGYAAGAGGGGATRKAEGEVHGVSNCEVVNCQVGT